MALPLPETVADALDAWRRRGLAAGHSERTIDARRGTIRRLVRDGHDPMTVTGDELEAWLGGLTLARSSKATYRAHLVAWFGWLAETGRRADDPSATLPSLRAPQDVPRPVSPADVQAILAACADPRARQAAAYVTLAAFAGLRVHEIAKIRGEDFVGNEIHVSGKGGKSSTVPATPIVLRLAETMPRTGWWFPTNSATGHVHRCSVSTAISRAMKRAGVAGTPHALRHFFCTEALRANRGDLRKTQRLARHSNPNTTARYTLVLDAELHEIAALIPGAA